MARGMLASVIVLLLFSGAPPESVAAETPLFQPWIDGTREEPLTQVQRYDADTYVIRQSIRTNFEGPFLYLFFGKDRALLLDTGAGGLDIRPAVEIVIAEWCRANGRAALPLLVAHTHAHGDHHQGDREFQGRADTTVIGLTQPEVAAFFHIEDWPNQIVPFDLGGRRLDIIPAPGHEDSHIVVFDERTGILQTGDTLYPGRLYFPVTGFAAYRDTIDRVVAFTRTHPVSHILANHIEMTDAAGQDYPMKAPSHPHEHALELPYAALLELQAALHAMKDTPVREAHRDFIIYPR